MAWPPNTQGMSPECVQAVRGTQLIPGNPPGTGGCYEFGELVASVNILFTIEVSCGCAAGRNRDTIRFEENVRF